MSRSIAGDNPVSKLSLLAITWPIFVESALQMFLRTSDTFMLSKVSDGAVAAVGVANQIIMFAVLMFNFVALGSAVVISQYLGARRQHEIGRLAGSSLALNFLFGLVVSVVVMMLSGPLLRIFDLDPSLFGQAKKYLLIAGGARISPATASKLSAVANNPGTWANAPYRPAGDYRWHSDGQTAADKRTARR